MTAELDSLPGHRVRVAARLVAAGGVVAYPTEAVYGLGCDPWNGEAVRRLLTIKQRPEHKGLILIASRFSQLAPFIVPLDGARMARVLASWPGPVTWLLPARPRAPCWLTGSHDTLAVRVTAHPLASALCEAVRGAIVSTSANLSDRPPARTALQVRLRLAGEADLILAGACGGRAQPSTICDGRSGVVIRS